MPKARVKARRKWQAELKHSLQRHGGHQKPQAVSAGHPRPGPRTFNIPDKDPYGIQEEKK